MTRPEAIEVIVLSTSTNETKAKGRVRKVTFEIPADGPNPFEGLGGERLHIVVVRINNDETPVKETETNPDPSAEPEKPRRHFNELPASAQIAMACQTASFREYMRIYYSARLPDDPGACDGYVKGFLGVASKKEVQPGTQAFARWADLHGKYAVWLKYERAA